MQDNTNRQDTEIEGFVRVRADELNENAIKLIGTDWMLITAGTIDNMNTMTASWGGLGMLWNRHVAFIFIRPQRYTYQFVEREDYFTCSFYDERFRSMLNFCGTYSGRDCNKPLEVGISPIKVGHSIAFSEARLIIECKKIYYQDINRENFLADFINKHYPESDYHRMFIGEITSAWINQEQ
jgi:flavin reductase (DIM6/NTAB) family NADH-FMN oxidoreductase RutF